MAIQFRNKEEFMKFREEEKKKERSRKLKMTISRVSKTAGEHLKSSAMEMRRRATSPEAKQQAWRLANWLAKVGENARKEAKRRYY